jgi:hypothetical protein
MAYRPAQIYTGSGWDDIGDPRVGTLETTVANKSNNPKTVDTKTANYTLVLGDRDKIVQMNSTSNLTITVPTNASVAFPVGTLVHVANINTGTLTIAGASGATVNEAGGLTLFRWESGTLYQRSANNWVFLKGGGLGAANFSNTSTGTYTDGGFNYKYVTFNASGTLTVTRAGFADVLLVGGGGGGGSSMAGAGGAGGHVYLTDIYLAAGSNTVTVGAGGAGATVARRNGDNGGLSSVGPYVAVGGGAGPGQRPSRGLSGGSGGGASANGGGSNESGGSGFQGNAGGAGRAASVGNARGGGGGGAGGAGASGTTSGNGGAGASNSITGTAVTRAAGGGAGSWVGTAGTGGSSIGGNGTNSNATAGNGSANTGSGGGGGGTASDGATAGIGGNGGSGVVIVRVRT